MTDDFSTQVSAIASTYGTDTIFILGKGPSADEVSAGVFAGSLVIGINDAERITPADITVFHADWVKEALLANGCRAQLYVTATDFRPTNGSVIKLPFARLTQDTADLMMQRLLGDQLVVEEVLFLTALKVAIVAAQARGRLQTVYMVGFDFRSELGYSHAIDHDYVSGDQDERSLKIGLQENFFLHALYMLRDAQVDIVHVGRRAYSRITPEELCQRFLQSDVEPRESHGDRVAVVAELTTNHFGDRHRLERMVRAAKAAGADFVKVQKRDVDTFYTKEQLAAPYRSPFGETFGDYRRQLELSSDDFAYLSQLCNSLGIDWFASILDLPSYHFILQFEPPIIKLPSTISDHVDYLRYVADNHVGPIVLSTGMTDETYERWVLETFNRIPRLFLLQCNSAYPTPAHDCHVGVVRHYHTLAMEHPHILPGYSSHDLGWMASALAVAAGARMVEKHVKLGSTDWAHFDAVAVDLTTPDFRDYVRRIRDAEVLVGSSSKRVNPSEHHKYSS